MTTFAEYTGRIMLRIGAHLLIRARAHEILATYPGDVRITMITPLQRDRPVTVEMDTVPAWRYTHHKRGGSYRVTHTRARVQCDKPLNDMDEVVVYLSEKDNLAWVRPPAEFDDGRFLIRSR